MSIFYLLLVIIMVFVLAKQYHYVTKKLGIPFGNKKIYYLMFPKVVLMLLGKPYKQSYNFKEDILSVCYHIEMHDSSGTIKYIFETNDKNKQILKKVMIELKCKDYKRAKRLVTTLKEEVLEFYGVRPTYNDFEEKREIKVFTNDFGIQRMDFRLQAKDQFTNLYVVRQ